MTDLRLIEWAIVIAAHLGVYYTFRYAWDYRRSPWKSGETGRALMFTARGMAAFFMVAVVGFWWPFPGYEYIYFAVLTVLVLGVRRQRKIMRARQRASRPARTGEF